MANVSDVDVEHRVINSENSTSVPGESSTTVHLKRFYFAHILLESIVQIYYLTYLEHKNT